MEKAAIVIGVDKPGDLPPLTAAASGALQVGNWLSKEGFTVKRFVDTKRPVVVGDLYNAIDRLLTLGTLDQLVIHFSGHGFLNSGSEHWMLSGAPRNGNEAVSLNESADLARRSGIPNVVFISDACRSLPQSFEANSVRGSLIFPTEKQSGSAKVDRFFATLPGDTALEMRLADSVRSEGIFTACFLEAYRRPEEEMVLSITVDGRLIRVVPNRRLEDFLKREVNRIAQEKSIRLKQLPEARVESNEPYYLGRVRKTGGRPTKTPAQHDTEMVASIADIARFELDRALAHGFPEHAPAVLNDGIRIGLRDALRAEWFGPYAFPGTLTGVLVTGAEVESAIGVNFDAHVFGDRVLLEPEIALADRMIADRADRDMAPAGSLILRFGDGSGTVLAVLGGYIANIVVQDGRVVNVSYIPSLDSRRWRDYKQNRLRLEDLRAKVAIAARFGVFQVNRETAGRLADEIRYLKSIDPTLGLYAAHAYADAGLQDEVRSVQFYMRNDLQADLFDVAMLAGDLSGISDQEMRVPRGAPVVPFCPMLGQGWGLLRVKGVRLAQQVSKAADHLRPALWTTFDSAGIDILEEALRRRDLR